MAVVSGERKTLDVKSITGEEIHSILPDLARLRMIVFRDWPYLYDGTLEYEEKYLKTFAAAKGAVVIAAYDGSEMVGASTGAPMIEHADEFGEPFKKAGYDISKIFYCGESVLLEKPSRLRSRARILRRPRGASAPARRPHAFDVLPCRPARRPPVETRRLCPT